MSKRERLFELLPVYLRQRDEENGSTLRMLLRVIEEQADDLRQDIDDLYGNWCVETCQEWVVPYLGELIGYQPIHGLGNDEDEQNAAKEKLLIPRREVANTIRYRRRKGTLALLEELASSVAGWPARAVEFGLRIAATQSMDDLQTRRGGTVNLRSAGALKDLGGPFDTQAHTANARSIDSGRSSGLYGASSVGLFVWRLKPYSVTHAPAYCKEKAGDHCFTFSMLANDTPLFNRPIADSPRKGASTRLNLPVPIRRQDLGAVSRTGEGFLRASEKYYGEGKSIAVWATNWAGCVPDKPVPATKIIPADLSQWKYRPPHGFIALDPELGRLAFPPAQLPGEDVHVSYHYGFSADLGGGEYERGLTFPPGSVRTYCVGARSEFPEIREAYHQWHRDKPPTAVIEISDSGVYEEQVHFELQEGQRLDLRAALGTRPTIYLLDWHASRPDAVVITGKARSRFTLEGILVTGRGIEVRGPMESVMLRHSTLVPGWALHHDSRPYRPGEPSISLVNTSASLLVDHSILGPIHVSQESTNQDPLRIMIADSILDATNESSAALSREQAELAPAVISLRRTTVFGELRTHAIELAENSIFTGQILVARRQHGCMRFCYVPAGSRTPRRYHCQPDSAGRRAETTRGRKHPEHDEQHRTTEADHLRVRPQFVSTRYGAPHYARLADICAQEIKCGADDESEMGAFHHLYEAQREANLRARLEEYTPAGFDAGIIYAS